ncbi:hypothetical protein FGO68_gene4752 [Halteria grandinella]|uniref:Peroxin-13 n=1 Tax=Halteria grandinella TaxID=5974 RepID=A0A8J8NLM5_HALGN|nr:hypothetical protein FGO68_gene4752 [Halteria grandinella]
MFGGTSALGGGYGTGGYGSSMYGGGGMGGMGGMYGGMGGMYGNNQGNMQNRPMLERMSVYVYQLCEIAQMVEFNANGLYGFFQLMKNISLAAVKFGNEWLWWLLEKFVEKMRQMKDWVKTKFTEYFLKRDLTRDQLQDQISVLQKVLRFVLLFVVVNLIRVAVSMLRKKWKA